MIDTNKYEGHNYNWYVKYHKDTGKHEVRVDGKNEVEDDFVCYLQYHPAFKDEQAKNVKLIADAPKLLAEVKRLRKQLDSLREFCHKEDYDIYNWEVKNIEVIE
tara:strand:+ start:28 stop:339 length:312 start_codon:yes stop_codon:yes gene_type:complete